MKQLAILFLLVVSQMVYSQIGINTTTPNPNAVLELKQNPTNAAKGLLITRLTDAQMTGMNLTSADQGMIIYNLTQKKFFGWDGTVWLNLGYEESNTAPYFSSTPAVELSSSNGKNIGATLTSSFTITDADAVDIPNVGSEILWNRGDDATGANSTEINGATASTYVTVTADTNKYLQSCVTPISSTGASPGIQKCSDWFGSITVPTSDLPYVQSFETQTGYTTSVPENRDSSSNYFIRTNGSNINATFDGNMDGTYFFAAQDIDAAVGSSSTQTLTMSGISIIGNTNLQFAILIAEDNASDGEQDWDDSDYVHIQYRIDGGAYQNLIWIENDGSPTNSAPFLDTDFDDTGDSTKITDTWSDFTANIVGTGSVLDIKITMNLNSGDEDIAIDNIRITGN